MNSLFVIAPYNYEGMWEITMEACQRAKTKLDRLPQ